MTTRTKNALGLFVFTVSSALAAWFLRRSARVPFVVLDAVPASSFFVAVLDVDLLRKSPLGAPLFEEAGAALAGSKSVMATCGFDPIERTREVAVAVPAEDDSGVFGVALRADVARDVVVECTRKILEARGAEAGVSFRQSGASTWVEPKGDLAKRYPTFVFREGGPYLAAQGPWLGAMVGAVEGKLPSARGESGHSALRRKLGQSSDERNGFVFLATVVLSREMRERLKKEMGAELAAGAGDTDQKVLMAGVLGVEAAGLGISAGEAIGADTRVLLELDCEDESACGAVAGIIENKRREWSQDPLVRVLGAGVFVDNLTVEAREKGLRVSTHASADEIAKWVARIFESKPFGSKPFGSKLFERKPFESKRG
jgi:hypothetical protein